MRNTLITILSVVVSTLWIQEAQAIPVTAYELIEDLSTMPDGNTTVNLRRTRFDGIASTVVEDVDGNITSGSENNVNGAFGVYTFNDVLYSHRSSWLSGVTTFTSGKLEIFARGVQNGIPANDSDDVYLETIVLPVGALAAGQTAMDIFGSSLTTLNFAGNDITAYMVDGILNVRIDKRANPNSDNMEIISSKLSLTYESTSASVPDGGSTLLLLGCALLGIGYMRNRLTA